MGRKRQRSRATLTDDDDDDDEPADAFDQDERQSSVWDAFKEEHHEVLEQLPLSLHRQFKLMHELDAQGEVLQDDLLAAVRRYICLRESRAAREPRSDVDALTGVGDSQVDGPVAVHQPNPGETTRTLLQYIAQSSEEAIRTAEEKVSIAQTAYETVDRHIRLLDQAIKEQEAAISLGVRPGTHLAPILLPDLVVPRWARPSRVEHSPVPSLSPEPQLYAEEPPVSDPQPSPKASKKGKKSVPKPEKEATHPHAATEGEEPLAHRTRRATVRLTIPAQPPAQVSDVPADPSEIRYCYCNRVSFGPMVGCDGVDCKLEWFHLECTGLSELPGKKAAWYCRECKPAKMTQKGRHRT